MKFLRRFSALVIATWLTAFHTLAGQIDSDFPYVSYIQFESFNIFTPEHRLNVGAQLRVPENNGDDMPAVVILHGSAGVDSRGALYAEALNEAGIATLEIDMWGARGISGGAEGPPLGQFCIRVAGAKRA